MDHEVAVVGGGVTGCATADALARDGVRVVLLERFELGHKRGSSHGRARVFRLSYPESSWVAMAQEALPLWRGLEGAAGRTLLRVTGGFDLGPGIERNAEALRAGGARFELLDPAEAATRTPAVRFPDDVPALFQPDAGVLMADDAVAAFAARARAHGAEVRERSLVERVDLDDAGVRVAGEGFDLAARAVVIAAGPWVNALLAPLDMALPVRATRETVAFFDAEDPPPPVVDWGEPTMYGLSNWGNGIKAGEHIAGPEGDPDERGRPDDGSVLRIAAWVARRFPLARPTPFHAETCWYTVAPDERFVLERRGRIVIGSPCSGHGFKFAPVTGRRLAALAAEALDG